MTALFLIGGMWFAGMVWTVSEMKNAPMEKNGKAAKHQKH